MIELKEEVGQKVKKRKMKRNQESYNSWNKIGRQSEMGFLVK